jgi:hypothetical protein
MEEVGGDQPAPAILESMPTVQQTAVQQAVVPQATPVASEGDTNPASDDGVVYTYYRGVKTAVNKPPVQSERTAAQKAAAQSAPATGTLDMSAAVAAMPVTQVNAEPVNAESAAQAVAQAAKDANLLHELEQLRAGMLEMSRRLQEMQQAQQDNQRNDTQQ